MKIRLDLLKHLTVKDVVEEAVANQHRYKAEPTFSVTGTGHLSPRSPEDSAREAERSTALTEKLKKQSRNWENWRQSEVTLGEVFDLLRSCHRRAPFLFFNGVTFAELGRTLATAVFADLSTLRRKEAASVVAHYITGVLDRAMMESVIRTLEKVMQFARVSG